MTKVQPNVGAVVGYFTYNMEPGKSLSEIDWEWLYGTLPVGEYRIVKSVMDFVEAGSFEEKEYFAEFAIID